MWDKLAKLLVKASLKLAAPIVGGAVADAAGDLAGILLDKHTKDTADAVQQRLLRRIGNELRKFGMQEDVTEEQLAPIEATVAAVLGNEKAMTAAWAGADFDARRAA